MADQKNNFPFVRANGHTRNDDESGSLQRSADELKRKKRIKLAIYISVFVVFQIIVITVFGLTVMRAKSPKLRLANIEIQTLTTTNTATSRSFDIAFSTQVRVKNTNFGRYKFDNTTVDVLYDGVSVGDIFVAKGRAGMKSTKKINNVVFNLSSAQIRDTTRLGSELSSGNLTFTSTAKMTGKVELMMIMKKNKSAEMNCTIVIDVATRNLKDLKCK